MSRSGTNPSGGHADSAASENSVVDGQPLVDGQPVVGVRKVIVLGGSVGAISMGDGAVNNVIQTVDPVLVQMRQTAGTLARSIKNARRPEFTRRQLVAPLQVRWHHARAGGVGANMLDEQRHVVEHGMPDHEDLAEVYRRVPSKRMVVLGRPGSGKSILAMRFVLDTIKARGVDDAVPVIFNLGSWDPREKDLKSWLLDRLLFDVPALRAKGSGRLSLGADLLTAGWILPVLDGFDEITAEFQQKALRELNAADLPMLLTSHFDPYVSAATAVGLLTGAETIVLDDLSLNDLSDYLSPPVPGLAPRKWDPVLARLRDEPDVPACAAVRAALSTPLMAGLARTVYGDAVHRDPADLLDITRFPASAEIEAHLLRQFVPTVYDQPATDPRLTEHRPPPWQGRGEDARRWLGYLALHQNEQAAIHQKRQDFEWWKLGDAVPWPQRLLIGGLLGAAVSGPVGWLVLGLRGGIVCALALGLLSGLVAGSKAPQPIYMEIRITGRAREALLQIAINLTGGLLVGLIGWPAVREWGWFMLPAAGAIANAIGSALSSWARHVGPQAQLKEIGLGFLGGSALGLAIGLVGRLAHLPTGGYPKWLVLGLTAGLATGLGAGLRVPMMLESVVEPPALLAANRRYAIFQALTIGSAFGIIAGVLGGPKYIAAGPVIGIAFGLGAHAWGRWLILARIVLPLRGCLPWPMWAFLADAHEREVLRQAGAVYQFRHDRLKDSLAARDGLL